VDHTKHDPKHTRQIWTSATFRNEIRFFCDACHKLEVDIYFLARSVVDIIETGWNLSIEKRM
jgi:hypothetical protein